MISPEWSRPDDLANPSLLGRADVQVLTPEQERGLLVDLDDQRRLLAAEASARRYGCPIDPGSGGRFDVQEFVRTVLAGGAPVGDEDDMLRAVARNYNATRTRLAMANLRLVAHVARRYRDRGLSPSDLLQEGFCGLLTAIDRYEVSNTTRLASYAVWWIRQSLQRAVAAGVYPVRLNPRHLQKLAASSNEPAAQEPRRARSRAAEATLKQIHAATRPSVSLDSPLGPQGRGSLIDTLSSTVPDEIDDRERDERLSTLLGRLKPRERLVVQLRYGLDGHECHSLSQVSQVLDVSKERVRQIQDASLAKLREEAGRDRACCEVG